jgi:hypothetical protein
MNIDTTFLASTLLITDEDPLIVKNGITAANNSLLRSFMEHPVHVFINKEQKYLLYHEGKIKILDNDLLDFDRFNNVIFGSIVLIDKFKVNDQVNKAVQMSDCYTYALYKNVKLSMMCGWFDWKSLIKIPIYFLKERRIGKLMNHLIMQTEKDVEILKKLKISLKGVSIPNVPILTLNGTPFSFSSETSIGWCATFEGSYLKIAKWFFDTTLIPFLKKNTEVKLNIIGSGSSEIVRWMTNRDEQLSSQLIVHEYLENLNMFYNLNKVNISPIFKGYGLINKSIEAMASKSLVIGDATAFNGLNVEHMKSVLIAKDKNDWHTLMNYALFTIKKEEYLKITNKAYDVVSAQLSLSSNNKILKSIMV